MTTTIKNQPKTLCLLSKLIHALDSIELYSHIHVILEVDGEKIPIEKLRDVCSEKLLCYKQFHSKINSKTFTWEKTKVHINDHVKEVELNTEHLNSKEAMERFVSSKLSQPFDSNKPLWNIYSLYHKKNDANYICFNISHALGDGKMITAILSSLMTTSRNDKTTQNPDTIKSDYSSTKSSAKSSTKSDMLSCLFLACIIIACFKNSWTNIILFGILYIVRKNYAFVETIVKLISGTPASYIRSSPDLTGSKKIFAKGDPMSVKEIKNIGKKLGNAERATVNDVIMSAISAAVSRYHVYKNVKEVPKIGHVYALTGLDRHKLKKTTQELLEEYKNGIENDISLFLVPTHLDVSLTPIDRLHKTQETMTRSKKSPQHVFIAMILKLLDYIDCIHPFAKFIEYLCNTIADSYMSNVIVPPEYYKLCNRDVRNIYHCTSPLKLATTFNVLSYNDTLTVCCATDANHIPDPHVLLRFINEEVQKLNQLV